MIAGAVLATAGAAHAQSGVSAESNSTVPWYQRFTTSSGVTESITGDQENDRLMSPAWNLSQRWGVTVDVREARSIDLLPDRGDQTSVGAFYQFTPNMRFGGELSVQRPETNAIAGTEPEEPRADVRIESAFRF